MLFLLPSLMLMQELLTVNLEDEIEGISRWKEFEKGFEVNAGFANELVESVDGEAADEKDMWIDAELLYSYYNNNIHLMIKPAFAFEQHLNDKINESMVMTPSLAAYKDIHKTFAAGLNFEMPMNKANSDADMVTGYDVSIEALYMPIDPLTVSLGFGIGKEDTDAEDNTTTLRVGINYEIFAK